MPVLTDEGVPVDLAPGQPCEGGHRAGLARGVPSDSWPESSRAKVVVWLVLIVLAQPGEWRWGL